MKFPSKVICGIQSVLILASRYGEGSLSASQIAKKVSVGVMGLEQILNFLKRNGFLRSVRGPQGGYVLAKKPSEITLARLFHTLVGENIFPTGKIDFSTTEELELSNFIFWKRLEQSFEKTLTGMTIQDLLTEARRAKKSKVSSGYPFHI